MDPFNTGWRGCASSGHQTWRAGKKTFSKFSSMIFPAINLHLWLGIFYGYVSHKQMVTSLLMLHVVNFPAMFGTMMG